MEGGDAPTQCSISNNSKLKTKNYPPSPGWPVLAVLAIVVVRCYGCCLQRPGQALLNRSYRQTDRQTDRLASLRKALPTLMIEHHRCWSHQPLISDLDKGLIQIYSLVDARGP